MKASKVLFLVFLIILSLCAVNTQPVRANPKTIVVPDDYSTIEAAINSAAEGDTIFVKKGIYESSINQTLVINKTLSLIGEDVNSTQINFHPGQFPQTFNYHGQDITFMLWDYIIKINANGVKLSGFTLATEYGGFSVTGNGIQIIGNIINAGIFGTGDSIQISNNIAGGIWLTGSNLSIVHNIIDDAIECDGSYNNVTANNVGNPERYILMGYEPYYLHPCINVGSFSVVIGNNITVGGLGLNGNGSIASKNNVTSGIWVNGLDNIVRANTINHGGFIITGFNNTFYANTVAGSNHTNRQYNYNLHRYTFYSLESAPYAISMGTIYDSVLGGNNYEDAANNTFYHNNFVGNTQLRLWDGVYGPNFWDNGSEGNYWSNYNGTDANHDGIGDTPYMIDARDRDYQPRVSDGTNQDNYPLMAPFDISSITIELPEFPDTKPPAISVISPENKTYTMSNVSLTVTLNEVTSWMGYSLDGQTNVTIIANITLNGLSDGSHSITVYANDTAGNTGASETIYFSRRTQHPRSQSESFPTWIVATIVIIAVVGVALLVYFVKVKKTTGKAEK